MTDSINGQFDSCIDRLRAGEDLESVLKSYPDGADELRVLMQTAKTIESGTYATSPAKKLEAKLKFETLRMHRKETSRIKKPWYARPLVWSAVATAAVVLLAVYVGVRPAFSPGAPLISEIVPVASPSGNFAFLISDDVNAISDFGDVTVGIGRIGLQQSSDGKWIEIPLSRSVDLTRVPGSLTEEIWRGDLPLGEYKQVFVYVDNVTGALKATGERVEIKLPGQKLHLGIPFSVSQGTVTSFTFDLTVFRTGNNANAKYILKPQVGESGAQQSTPDGGSDQSGKSDKQPVTTARPPTPSKKTPKK